MKNSKLTNIGYERKSLGCSRSSFALILDLNASTLNMIERGLRPYPASSIAVLSRLFWMLQSEIQGENLSETQLKKEKETLIAYLKDTVARLNLRKWELTQKLEELQKKHAETHVILENISRISFPPEDVLYSIVSSQMRLRKLLSVRSLNDCDLKTQYQIRTQLALLDLEIQMATDRLQEVGSL